MSLDWRVDKIEGYKHVCWTGTGKFYEEKGKQKEHTTLKPETEALVWPTLSVSMHSITKKNWREFYLRMLLNPYLISKTRHVKPEDVYRHIGLTTNVTYKSRAKYLRDLYDRENRLHAMTFYNIDKVEHSS